VNTARPNHEVATGVRVLRSATLRENDVSFLRAAIYIPAFYSLGDERSQNTTSKATTTLGQREHEDASKYDP
jgi:hypothetical protein